MGDGLIVCVPGIQDTFLGKTDLFELDPLKQMYSCACASKYICNYILQIRHVKSLGQSQSDANKNKYPNSKFQNITLLTFSLYCSKIF